MNFELELLNWIRFYPVFHIKRLELADPEILIQTKKSPRLTRYNKYKVEKIKDYNLETRQYIIKWKRYLKKKNTWEPIKYLKNCKKIIRKSEYPLEEDNTIIRNFDFQKSSVRK